MDFEHRKKHIEIYQKVTKKLLQRQNINSQINSRFTPATTSTIGTYVLILNSTTQKGISKILQPLRKGPYQIIDKPTDVTYNFTELNKKEIVQHRNNLLLNYTLLKHLKLFKIAQNTIKIKTLIYTPSKNN